MYVEERLKMELFVLWVQPEGKANKLTILESTLQATGEYLCRHIERKTGCVMLGKLTWLLGLWKKNLLCIKWDLGFQDSGQYQQSDLTVFPQEFYLHVLWNMLPGYFIDFYFFTNKNDNIAPIFTEFEIMKMWHTKIWRKKIKVENIAKVKNLRWEQKWDFSEGMT